jgi:site-specific recombinase XerD
MLELMYGLGLRVSEVVELPLERLDLESRLVRVVGKGARERILPLGGAAVRALEAVAGRRTAALVRRGNRSPRPSS